MKVPLIEILKLSATPPTIVYPFPFIAFLGFSLSGVFNFYGLFNAIVFSSLFQSAANLWNHVNDVEEDRLSGKKNILIENANIRKSTIILSVILYSSSFFIVYHSTINKNAMFLLLIAFLATWLYSDKIFFGKKIRRLKEHYLTEVLTYLITIPSFTLTLWSFFSPFSFRSIAFAILVTLLMLSLMVLKDIKDMTGDRLAGLKTLGVVFYPETLIKISLTLLTFYYVSILFFTLFGVLSKISFVSLLSSLGLIYTTSFFLNTKWRIDLASVKPMKILIHSNLVSLLLLILAGIIQTQELQMYQLN